MMNNLPYYPLMMYYVSYNSNIKIKNDSIHYLLLECQLS